MSALSRMPHHLFASVERPDVTGVALLDDDTGSVVWTGPPTSSRQTLIVRARDEGLSAASIAPVMGDDIMVENSLRLTLPASARSPRSLQSPVVSARGPVDTGVDRDVLSQLFTGTSAALAQSAEGQAALAERQIDQLERMLEDERRRARVAVESLRLESQTEIGRLRGELDSIRDRSEERRLELTEKLAEKRAQLEADSRRQRTEDQAAARDELRSATDRLQREVEAAKRSAEEEVERLKRQLRDARDEVEDERDKRRRQARESEEATTEARMESSRSRQLLEEELETARGSLTRSRKRSSADEEGLLRLFSEMRESDDPESREMLQQIVAKRVGVAAPNPQNAQLAQLAQMFMDVAARRFGMPDDSPSAPSAAHANPDTRATQQSEELVDL